MSRLSYTVATAAEATGLSKAHITAAIKGGQLAARRSGVNSDGEPAGKYVIFARDLEAWLEGLAAA